MAASSETAPLLQQVSINNANDSNGLSGEYNTIPARNVTEGIETTWKTETKLLARYSAPLIITYVLQ